MNWKSNYVFAYTNKGGDPAASRISFTVYKYNVIVDPSELNSFRLRVLKTQRNIL